MYNSNDQITKLESIEGLVKCLIKNGEIDKASKMFCKSYIKNRISIHKFPVKLICKELHRKIRYKSTIYVPIIFSIYTSEYNDKYLSDQGYSMELYLEKNNINDFKCLLNIKRFTDQKSVEYFLEHVFTPNSMKGTIIYNNSNEIESLRISICQFLIENKIGNNKKLLQELKNRSRNLVINNANTQISNTKIYYDLEYIRNKTKREHKFLFKKYIKSLKNDYSNDNDEIQLNIYLDDLNKRIDKNPEFENNRYESLLDLHLENLFLNKKNDIFMSLLREVRNEFTDGLKGLGGYLSTRIKHGMLETHFRKALLEDKLIYKLKDGSYYWGNELYEHKSKVDNLLDTFSDKFMSIISNVIGQWLQLNKIDPGISKLVRSKNNGLFNCSISNLLSFYLQKQLDKKSSYDDFLELSLDWLEKTTDKNLKEIQVNFEKRLIPEFQDIFNELNVGLVNLNNNYGLRVSEISTAVTSSQQKLIKSIRICSEWFMRNIHMKKEKYDFDAVLESVDFSLSLCSEKTVNGIYPINAAKLTYYQDIIYMLYTNAIKHSGCNKDETNLKCKIYIKNKLIIIKVTNNCIFQSKIKRKNRKLKLYKNIYSKTKSIEKLKREGGTGIYKIQKIIKEDLGLNYICKLKYKNDSFFQVKLKIIL